MRPWDLSAGAAKIQLALETLELAQAEVMERWKDETAGAFQRDYLDPLRPRVRRTLDAIDRLAHVLDKAEWDLEPE